MDDEVQQLQCQCRHKGTRCGKLLGAIRSLVVPTGRTFDHVTMLNDKDCLSLWCKGCGKASEFRILTQLEDAA